MAVVAAWALSLDRKALWPVVQACVATYKLSGLPFPCLEVDLSRGEAGGFVVLRPPVGPPDTILAPTRRLTGVEDPFLQSPDAPNYFADAWNARGLIGEGRDEPPPDRVGLVVNPLSLRSQDQLHIHIGCLVPGNSGGDRGLRRRRSGRRLAEAGPRHAELLGLQDRQIRPRRD